MKRYLIAALLIVCSAFLNVRADEIVYTNDYGVNFNQTEYDYYTQMYWDGYQAYVKPADFNRLLTYDIFSAEIKSVSYDEDSQKQEHTRDTIETKSKKLTLSYACVSNVCDVVIGLVWKGLPTIKSYDVIGGFMLTPSTLTRLTLPTTVLNWSGSSIFFTDRVLTSNGFGCSVKLQNSTTAMTISQNVMLQGTGTFLASYQHATSNITLETSKKYTTGVGGYGGVFNFYGNAVGKFDQMAGVSEYIS